MNAMENNTFAGTVPPVLKIEINRAALAKMPRQQVEDLGSVALLLLEVATAFACQPRFASKGDRPNAAGEALQDLARAIGFVFDATEDAAELAPREHPTLDEIVAAFPGYSDEAAQ